MEPLSASFNANFKIYKIFGLWPGNRPHSVYKYYSILFLFFTLVIFVSFLSINLIYIQRKIEVMVPEVVFIFAEIMMITKALMIVFKWKDLIEALKMLDSMSFQGKDTASINIVVRYVSNYKLYWIIYTMLAHIAYVLRMFIPLFSHVIFNTTLELPICSFSFLDLETLNHYFAILYFYQTACIYSHMFLNTNSDTLIAGLILMAIVNVKVLQHELQSLRVDKKWIKMNKSFQDALQISKLRRTLEHYEEILKYCYMLQEILSVTMFFQFTIASGLICVLLCCLLLSSSIQTLIFFATLFCAMVLQIFVPAYLGTELSYQSEELVSAAYSSEWIPRCESFKRSLKLFMERAKTNIMLTGGKLFPLTLDTSVAIVKTAYSFFALIRNFQDRE
ncbi:odorant receptor 59a-like [Leptidea sinapis]|uniref:odorant receptor 59a-like n=1 Tax=Leptidea sinapis TaxID=189913 RepID=UPI0021C259FE|nr:odorant receptor 59a-like [Leptidea sinapis]